LFANSGIQVYPYKVNNSQNNLRDVIFHKASLTDGHGVVTGIIGAILDVTELKQAVEAVEKIKALLNASQRLSMVGGWEYNVATQTMEWTEETYRIHDLAPGEPEPVSAEHIKRSAECYEPEDRPVILAAFQRCVEEGQPYDLELPFTTAKGRRLWIRTVAQPVVESGKVIRVNGNIMDITARKRTEAALRERNSRYELLWKGAAGGTWDWDVPNKRVDFSIQWKTIRGYAEDEISDNEEEWSAGIHPEDAPRIMASLEAFFAGRADFWEEEYRVRCKNGSYIWVYDHGAVIRDAAGQVLRMSGSELDITKRKQVEEAQMESELKFRTLVEASSAGIWKTDAAGRNTYVSPRWCELAGIAEADATGHGWAAGLHPDDRILVRTGWEAAAAAATPYAAEFRFVHPDRRLVWVDCQAAPVMVGGRVTEWIGTITDITSRKEAEAA
jgi:PAS domain S-box-containing protein